jgi:hypothetical protein
MCVRCIEYRVVRVLVIWMSSIEKEEGRIGEVSDRGADEGDGGGDETTEVSL